MLCQITKKYHNLCIVAIMLLFTAGSYPTISVASNTSCRALESLQPKEGEIIDAGIHVNNFPVGVSVNPLTNKIYVTNEFSNTVSVIDGDTDVVLPPISVGGSPYDLDVDHYTNKVYVTNLGYDTISIIDGETNKVVGTIQNITTPVGIDVDHEKELDICN